MSHIIKTEDLLVIEKQKLSAFLEITNSVNKNYTVEDLLVQFENVMKHYIGISKLSFINYNTSWNCILNYGMDSKCSDIDTESLLNYTTTTFINDSELKNLESFDILLPVLHNEKPLSFLLIGGIKEGNMLNFIQNHVGFVQTITNVVSVAIESKTINKELLAKELEEKDMKMAAEMQKLLLPEDLPSNHLIDISASYIAKHKVSGDYYDFIRINEDEYVFCIADVSGKGMSAAMLMSNFQATLKANVKYNHHNLTLEGLVMELNQSVIEAAKGEKFITFFIGYYNEKSRRLKYINAGHNYPILIQNNQVMELKTGCTALGIFEVFPSIETQVINIDKNTIIVCYTDGLVEVENANGEQFQTERLAKAISSFSYLNMKQMNLALLKEIYEYKGENELPDDTAILSLRII